MDKLPDEIILLVFELVSFADLNRVMLVCRRWRKIGETPSLWSSLHVSLNTRNMSVMSDILNSGRMQGLRKLRIEQSASNLNSYTY